MTPGRPSPDDLPLASHDPLQWVGVLDFEPRFLNAIKLTVERKQARA